MDEIEIFALQNKLRKHLNEINRSNITSFMDILIKYSTDMFRFDVYISRYRNENYIKPFGDYLLYIDVLWLLTNDLEKNKDLIRLIESL